MSDNRSKYNIEFDSNKIYLMFNLRRHRFFLVVLHFFPNKISVIVAKANEKYIKEVRKMQIYFVIKRCLENREKRTYRRSIYYMYQKKTKFGLDLISFSPQTPIKFSFTEFLSVFKLKKTIYNFERLPALTT